MNPRLCIVLVLATLLLSTCQKEPTPTPTTDVIRSLEVSLNPSGYAPLTARLDLTLAKAGRLRITVPGRNLRGVSDAVFTTDQAASEFSVPILGLLPDWDNKVVLELLDNQGLVFQRDSILIQTEALIPDLPLISPRINTFELATNTFILFNYLGYESAPNPNRPFIADYEGDIRWFLDFTNHPELNSLAYDGGLTQLANRNFIFGNQQTNTLYEVDVFGFIQNTYDLQGYEYHNTVFEKTNGHFLVTVSDPNKPTVKDIVLEIDRNSGAISNIWDLSESLDPEREAWPSDLNDFEQNWFDINGVAFDDQDQSIIVSGRTQGVVKLTQNNEVIWILAPHRDWGFSGKGIDLSQYVLQPLDANDQPISDLPILEGLENHPDFEWCWYQHAPYILETGHLLLFDNGENRNYSGGSTYSRVVEYEIDEPNGTIRQIWDYGMEPGQLRYSRLASNAVPKTPFEGFLISSGSVDPGLGFPQILEIERETTSRCLGDPCRIYEATVVPPSDATAITFHSAVIIDLYPK